MSRESSLVPTNLLNWPRTDSLLPDQRLILIWLWASPNLTSAGCGLVPIRPAAATLGLDPAALRGGLQTLCDVGLIDIDEETCELFVCDWFRFHKFKSPIQLRNLESDINKINSHRLKRVVLEKSTTYKTTATSTSTSTSTKTKYLKPLAQVASDQRQSPRAGIENKSSKGVGIDGLGDKSKITSDEQEFELQAQRPGKRKKPAAIVTEQNAFPEVTDRALVADWFALREMKRAPITMTVIEGFRREIAKINFTEEQGLRKWCERGWVGFDAAWVEKELRSPDGRGGGGMPNRHTNFEKKDYRKGVSENGRLTVSI